MKFEGNFPVPPVEDQRFEILVRLPGDYRTTVGLAAPDIFAAKNRAAEMLGVTYEDTQLLAIIDRAPQAALAF